MDNTLEAALADEILAEVARQRYSATQMQAMTGIKSRSWQNYVVNRSRPIPIKAVTAIARALGLPASELMRRAERRVGELSSHSVAAERALAQLPPELAEKVRAVDREMRNADSEDDVQAERTTRVARSASTGR